MNIQRLAKKVEENPTLVQELKQDPAAALRKIAQEEPAYRKDVWTYRVVVVALGIALILALTFAFVLRLNQLDIPDLLVALGSGAVGALAGLLNPSGTGSE